MALSPVPLKKKTQKTSGFHTDKNAETDPQFTVSKTPNAFKSYFIFLFCLQHEKEMVEKYDIVFQNGFYNIQNPQSI